MAAFAVDEDVGVFLVTDADEEDDDDDGCLRDAAAAAATADWFGVMSREQSRVEKGCE